MFAPRACFAALLLAVAGVGCQPQPVRPESESASAEVRFPTERYANVDPAVGRVFEVDPAASEVRIYVYRDGPLAARGHNHVIVADDLVGAVLLPAEGLASAAVDLVVPVERLRVDPPELRQRLGGSFAAEVPADAAAATRKNMLGEAVLAADRHPLIGVSAVRVGGELPKLVLEVAISLHGQTRRQLVPVDVRLDGDRLQAHGALAIRQSEFGMTPMSALGGLLRVQDEVMVEFRVVARARR